MQNRFKVKQKVKLKLRKTNRFSNIIILNKRLTDIKQKNFI